MFVLLVEEEDEMELRAEEILFVGVDDIAVVVGGGEEV